MKEIVGSSRLTGHPAPARIGVERDRVGAPIAKFGDQQRQQLGGAEQLTTTRSALPVWVASAMSRAWSVGSG